MGLELGGHIWGGDQHVGDHPELETLAPRTVMNPKTGGTNRGGCWRWWFSCSVVSDSWDPMDCSLPGSSVHGILQARVLEWGCHFLHQGTFLIQGLNLRLPHCRQVLYSLSHQGRPKDRRRYERRTVRSSSSKGSKSRKRISVQSKWSEVLTVDFPGGLVVETLCFQCRGQGIWGQRSEIPGLPCGTAKHKNHHQSAECYSEVR